MCLCAEINKPAAIIYNNNIKYNKHFIYSALKSSKAKVLIPLQSAHGRL